MEDISWNHSLKAQASLSHIRTHSVVVTNSSLTARYVLLHVRALHAETYEVLVQSELL